jgi:hypothetical protein
VYFSTSNGERILETKKTSEQQVNNKTKTLYKISEVRKLIYYHIFKEAVMRILFRCTMLMGVMWITCDGCLHRSPMKQTSTLIVARTDTNQHLPVRKHTYLPSYIDHIPASLLAPPESNSCSDGGR